jgi:hypothetical protein
MLGSIVNNGKITHACDPCMVAYEQKEKDDEAERINQALREENGLVVEEDKTH